MNIIKLLAIIRLLLEWAQPKNMFIFLTKNHNEQNIGKIHNTIHNPISFSASSATSSDATSDIEAAEEGATDCGKPSNSLSICMSFGIMPGSIWKKNGVPLLSSKTKFYIFEQRINPSAPTN